MKKYALLLLALTLSLNAQVQIDSITWGALDQHETAIAVSPINPKYVIATWNDFRSNFKSEPGYAVSSDGGLTWFKKGIMEDISDNLTYGFDPSCGFDRYGNMYYCYNTYINEYPNYPRGPVYISKSANYGTSWQHILVSENYMYNQDKPYMAVDNTGGQYDGRVYVVWRNSSGTPLIAYLPKNGDAFTGAQTLTGSLFCPMPVVAPNGDVFVVTRTNGYFYFYKSTNGGTDFNYISSEAISVFPDYMTLYIYKIWANPSYTIDPNNGYQYLAYTKNNSIPYQIIL